MAVVAEASGSGSGGGGGGGGCVGRAWKCKVVNAVVGRKRASEVTPQPKPLCGRHSHGTLPPSQFRPTAVQGLQH